MFELLKPEPCTANAVGSEARASHPALPAAPAVPSSEADPTSDWVSFDQCGHQANHQSSPSGATLLQTIC